MINIRAEVVDVQRKIGAEVKKIVQGLRNEVAVARARENEMIGSMRTIEAKVAGLNQRQCVLLCAPRTRSPAHVVRPVTPQPSGSGSLSL